MRATFDRIDLARESALHRAHATDEITSSAGPAAEAHCLTMFLQGVQVMSTADPQHPKLEASIDQSRR